MKVCPSCGLQYPDDEQRCFVDRAPLVAADDPYLGTTLGGRYHIEALLGEGGMATVYRARHALVDKPVAIKIMAAHMAKHPSMKERFRREAKNAAAIAHPNIIRIDDHGETPDGAIYLVMELLIGAPLTALIAAGPIAPSDTANLGLQIARGLARAHDFDVIHRDLKPDNLFVVDPQGTPLIKILDFGIARSMHDERLTNAGEIFGTPQYMAPERVTSIDAGPSADLYALGVILFEMVTGQTPFHSEQITGYFIKHMTEAPRKPSALAPQCPRRLEELILALLEKKPENRPVDAHQVIKELSVLAPSDRSSLPPPPLPVVPSRGAVAPTLPPTTLERWTKRSLIFERMVIALYPHGAPPGARRDLDEIRQTIDRMTAIRSEGLKEQRRLEELETKAVASRERLGNAVDTLAQDLSAARNAARSAAAEVAPYFEAGDKAKSAYHGAHETFERAGGYRLVQVPDAAYVQSLRHTVDALDRWLMAHGSAEKARRWMTSKEDEVKDLEFQIQALRAQLARVEAEYDKDRSSIEAALRARGEETEALERALISTASRFVEPLRTEATLRDLFEELETAA